MKHSGYLTTSGAEIYYEQYGCGTPLLILHGNSQSLAVFYPFLRTFLPDFQVILMDSRGHGRSRLSVHTALHGFSTEDMADDVIALLNHLHLSSVHLLGFSDGANIGLEIACKYPERLKTLICISANASPDGLLTPLYLAAQMLHSILNLLGNLLLPVLKCLFCLCILRVLRGLCTVHPESFPAISEEFLCFRHIRSLYRQRKARSFRLNFPPDSGRTKKEA